MKPLALSVCLAAWLLLMAAATRAADLYVSPEGRDGWSGRIAAPNADKTDGPLASLAGARDAIRKLRSAGPVKEPVNVVVADGTYSLAEPLVFTAQDSGTAGAPITYRAAEGARPASPGSGSRT